MTETNSDTEKCPECGGELTTGWMCPHCGHAEVGKLVRLAGAAVLAIVIALASSLVWVNVVFGGVGAIMLLTVFAKLYLAAQVPRQLDSSSARATLRKATVWTIGLVVAGALLFAGYRIQITGGVAQFIPTPTIVAPPMPSPLPTLSPPRYPSSCRRPCWPPSGMGSHRVRFALRPRTCTDRSATNFR